MVNSTNFEVNIITQIGYPDSCQKQEKKESKMNTDSIIESLILLGRSKEEAVRELLWHQRRQEDEMNWKIAEKLYDNWVKSRHRY